MTVAKTKPQEVSCGELIPIKCDIAVEQLGCKVSNWRQSPYLLVFCKHRTFIDILSIELHVSQNKAIFLFRTFFADFLPIDRHNMCALSIKNGCEIQNPLHTQERLKKEQLVFCGLLTLPYRGWRLSSWISVDFRFLGIQSGFPVLPVLWISQYNLQTLPRFRQIKKSHKNRKEQIKHNIPLFNPLWGSAWEKARNWEDPALTATPKATFELEGYNQLLQTRTSNQAISHLSDTWTFHWKSRAESEANPLQLVYLDPSFWRNHLSAYQ